MLEHLSHYLSLNDQLSLRLTCRRLRAFFSDRAIKKLAVFVKDHPYYYRLFDSDEEIGYRNSLRVPELALTRRFGSSEFRNWFADIRKLVVVYDGIDEGSKLNHLSISVMNLNFFKALEHLELKIGRLTTEPDSDSFFTVNSHVLDLPQLRTCCIYTRHPSEFAIQCWNLSTLSIGGQAIARIKPIDQASFHFHACVHNLAYQNRPDFTPLSEYATDGIRRLFFNGAVAHLKSLVEQCTSLISLTVNSYQLTGQFMAFASDHESLREVRIVERSFDLTQLAGILNYKLEYGVPFELFFYNVNVESEQFREMCNRFRSVRSLSSINKTNYRTFAGHPAYFDTMLPLMKELHLTDFDLSQEFVRKLKSIETLKIASEADLDEATFFAMLETFKQLKSLSLNSMGGLSQRCASSIPDYFLNLRQLEIKNCRFDDFSFIVHLSNLSSLTLDGEVGTRDLTIILNERPATLESVQIEFAEPRRDFHIYFEPNKFVVLVSGRLGDKHQKLSFYKTPNLVRFIFSSPTEAMSY